MILPHPISTLFPYTTLFRSRSRPLTPRRAQLAARYGAGGVALLVAGIALVGHAAALDSAPASAVLGLAGIALCWSAGRSEEHTSELQSRLHLVCRLLLEKKN